MMNALNPAMKDITFASIGVSWNEYVQLQPKLHALQLPTPNHLCAKCNAKYLHIEKLYRHRIML